MSVEDDLLTTAARPDPRRMRAQLYPVRTPVAVRLSDIDVFGHVNNVAMNDLHQEARATLLDRVWEPVDGVRPVQTIAVQQVTHYLAEGFHPDTVTCCAGVGRTGSSSFVLATAVLDGAGTAISLGDTTFVLRLGGELLPVRGEVRERLAAFALRRD